MNEHKRVIRPALPSVDREFLLKLLQLEIAAYPPPAEVLSLTFTAEAGQSSQVQLGLFAPQMPEPSRLDGTITRLKVIAGEDRVGSPVLEDSHRSGSFRMEGFAVTGAAVASKGNRQDRNTIDSDQENDPLGQSLFKAPYVAYIND
jgi:protein ImuB